MKKLNKIERNHILRLFYDFINMIKNFIFFAIISIGVLITKIGLIKSILISAILIIVIILYQFLAWRKNFFIVKTNSIYHEEGIFSIKKIEIPLDRINTIDISQKLLERIFKVATIKIDTGDTNKDSELKFTLDKDKTETLKNILLKNQNITTNTPEEDNQLYYILSSKHLLIYSLISNSLFKGLGLLLVAQQFLDDYFKAFININTSDYINKLQKDKIYNNIKIILFFVIALILISLCLSIIYNFFKYYNFKMWADEKNIYINYGALNKKNYSFYKEKVKGIHIKQTILMQCFKFFTLEIESIGYGDEEGEKSILYPICNASLKNHILKNIFEEFQYTGQINKPPKNTYFRFLYKKFILWAVTAAICFFIKPKFALLSFIFLLFLFIMGHLEFKNTAFGMDKNIIYMCCHGFNKTQSLLKINAVQSMTLSYSYFQYNKGLCNYSIILHSSSFGKTFQVKNLKNNLSRGIF
ncbi:PH domain-containing protein [Clostridium kluyveri]|uniref:YdbS-like PH domain-containing protein n=1 Tax=Clostridium kluyveri (strain NBRC 12016) TaxID=583346 RepID=B9E5F4_CLOK1|nr:hypothetical protein CKR_2678 [Clostridium kluyveri NBRC 12016]